MIESSSIEILKNSIDIVDVISSYIELKKSGSNYKANCPFHNEKTPSFVVSPAKQIFHCFGCGVGGDAIKFVMEIEKLNYKEAIEKLASLYNIPLQYSSSNNSFIQEKRVLELLEKWYKKNLKEDKLAQEYLKRRKISSKSIEEFNLGYVRDSNEVIAFLKSHNIPFKAAVDAGVVAKGQRGFYARLAHRIIFPIYNASGSIIGFGGRTINNHPAKYLNSPQTKLFDKSKVLYGYNIAKKEIFDKREIIITEGYLDVIMLHQVGFKNSVATLGTALTKSHLPLIKKGEPKVVLAYDGDSAGVNAALKAATLLSSNDFEGRVVLFPQDMDPADMVATGKIEELKGLLQGGTDLVIFVIEQIANKFNLNNPHQKQNAIKEAKEFLNTLSPLLRESYIIEAARILNTSSVYFTSKDSKLKKRETQINKDPAWEAILKTLLNKKELIDDVLNIIEPSLAKDYQEAFEALISNKEHPILRGIEIDETIPILSEEELKSQLIKELELFFRKKLKELAQDKKLDFNTKSYLIRKIKVDILPRLKRGEIVEYESDFFI
ncbi:MAG: DNA primase [Epsilonproteobacteria bacterium]|nr:DNA primase [Campylobacterota bacterium]